MDKTGSVREAMLQTDKETDKQIQHINKE